MNTNWFLILNPIAGNGKSKKNWSFISETLKNQDINFSFAFTEYSKHESILVENAIKNGFTKIISVGGDGTLHHIVNGIMSQKIVKTSTIKLAVIPIGTGNDWVKTYNIPANIDKSIAIIKKNNAILQDVGKIALENNTIRYFNILGGIGYDAYVANKLNSLKIIGSFAYLVSGIYGLLFYKKPILEIEINQQKIKTTSLMTVFGNCKYTGGGMRLTDYKSTTDGLFDVSIFRKLHFFDLFFNIKKLYTGTIIHHKKVTTFKTNSLKITPVSIYNIPFVQADGEVIGKGSFKATVITNAIQFIIP